MKRRTFKLSHSLIGTIVFLFAEGLLFAVLPTLLSVPLLLLCAALGAAANIYVATEVIEEVRSPRHMLALLTAVVAEFVVFFAFQFWFLILLQPASFPTLTPTVVPLLLHSTMIFVFNPFYLPATTAGQMLLLVEILGSLGLVLFILQNIWQFRRNNA